MKKWLKVVIIILVILVVALLAFFIINRYTEQNEANNDIQDSSIQYNNIDEIAVMDVVIVKVNERYLGVVNKDNPDDIMTVGIPDNDTNEYKQNQEIRVLYTGGIDESYPSSPHKVSQIEILKENSDIEIPEKVLKYFYSSRNNVEVSNIRVTQTGIDFEIKDTNDLKYEYKNTYTIYKKNERTEQVESPNIPVVTGNSTSSYEGSGKPLWEEVTKVSEVKSEATVTAENVDNNTVGKICDWTNLYGKLEDGEYEFVMPADGFYIRIAFSINESGQAENINYELQ